MFREVELAYETEPISSGLARHLYLTEKYKKVEVE
jgi:hypothetical protein